MKIIVDTNIVFSAILNSQGKIGNLIINGSKYFHFFSITLLEEEILNHRQKILSISGFTEQQFDKTLLTITSRITFLEDVLLPDNEINKALELVLGIDENDTLFLALTNYLKGKLWTGDKKLLNGLKQKGYNKCITTNDLNDLFFKKQLERRKRSG